MKEFKVGDRVRVYGYVFPVDGDVGRGAMFCRKSAGTLESLPERDGDFRWRVHLDSGHLVELHIGQCRRLVKKERRRVWVWKPGLTEALEDQTAISAPVLLERPMDASNWIEFVEVRPKK